MYTEENAKVVTAAWGTELIQFLAADLAGLVAQSETGVIRAGLVAFEWDWWHFSFLAGLVAFERDWWRRVRLVSFERDWWHFSGTGGL